MHRPYVHVAAVTDRGRVRERNEDAFVVADLERGTKFIGERYQGRLGIDARGVLVAVSDGMGGAAAGDVASHLVVDALARGLIGSQASRGSLERVNDAVNEAHSTVWEEACRRGIRMGATLTALFVRGDRAYVATVGDSRAYLIRGGSITQLTKDQSYVQLLVDAGAIAPAEADSAPFRNVITQAMGMKPEVEAVVGRLMLRDRDCVVVTSDGVHGVLSATDILSTVMRSSSLEEAAARVIAAANERGGPDNATVALVGVGGEVQRRGETNADPTYEVVSPASTR